MIRRDVTPPPAWILISQIEHAHLAARLAEHWGAGDFAPLWPHGELLWAIEHHDDGWRQWDLAPGVDPSNGRPRSFTEMVPADSAAIWSASIAAAREAGPLAAYVVAGHFCVLARRVSGWLSADIRREIVEPFLAQNESLMASCLSAWQALDPVRNTPAAAKLALAQLQFFDSLSLWFCCSEVGEADSVQAPAGPMLTLTPRGPQSVELAPWPLLVPQLDVEAEGRQVTAKRYDNREELAASPAQPVRLRWQLHPSQAES
jgi:uncharacterized protein DUF3891